MKKQIFILLIMVAWTTLFGQAKKPTLMVVPSEPLVFLVQLLRVFVGRHKVVHV